MDVDEVERCENLLYHIKLHSNVIFVGPEGEESFSVKNEELFRK
jgi:hypothetical protein